MKVKDLIALLRTEVSIEFRMNNNHYGKCQSNHLLTKTLANYEIEDWFVYAQKHCICINLKERRDDEWM